MKKILALVLVGSIYLTACDKTQEHETSKKEYSTSSTTLTDGWVELGKKTGGISMDYYQPSSQKQMDSYEVVAFKTILIQDDSKRKLKAGDYIVGEVALDCKNNQAGLLKSKIYSVDNTLKYEFDLTKNLQLKSVIQGEPTGRLLAYVCHQK